MSVSSLEEQPAVRLTNKVLLSLLFANKFGYKKGRDFRTSWTF